MEYLVRKFASVQLGSKFSKLIELSLEGVYFTRV